MPQKPIVLDAPTPQKRSITAEALQAEILEKLTYSVGKDAIVARPHDWLKATILAIRDRVIDLWFESSRATWRTSEKRVYYLSLEFLIGRLMRDAIAKGRTQYGMQTFDQSLFELFTHGLITYEEAVLGATNSEDLKLQLKGFVTSGNEDQARLVGA